MRWPWSKSEKRQNSNYTDGFVRALLASASGTGGADPSASAPLETAASLYSRAFAAAKVIGDHAEAITPDMMGLVGRNLIRGGNDLHLIEMTDGRIYFRPCGSWDTYGGDDEADWMYRVSLYGPDSHRTQYVPSAGLLHFRYSIDSSRPWRGLSPLAHARDTGALSGSLERRLSEEAAGHSGYFLPIPQDGGDGEDDDPLASLKADLAAAKGKTVLVETTSSGWGEGAGQAPQKEFQQKRFGADPPQVLKNLRTDSGMSILSACCVPLALAAETADGTALREAWRRFVMLSVEPLLKIVALEFSRKLETPISFDLHDLFAHDLAGRAQAFKNLIVGGLSVDDALAKSGLMMDEVA